MTYNIIMEWSFGEGRPVAVTTNRHKADWVCAELNAPHRSDGWASFVVVDAPSVDDYGVTAR